MDLLRGHLRAPRTSCRGHCFAVNRVQGPAWSYHRPATGGSRGLLPRRLSETSACIGCCRVGPSGPWTIGHRPDKTARESVCGKPHGPWTIQSRAPLLDELSFTTLREPGTCRKPFVTTEVLREAMASGNPGKCGPWKFRATLHRLSFYACWLVNAGQRALANRIDPSVFRRQRGNAGRSIVMTRPRWFRRLGVATAVPEDGDHDRHEKKEHQ